MHDDSTTRRKLLAGLSAGLALSVAGCQGDGDDGGDTEDGDGGMESTETDSGMDGGMESTETDAGMGGGTASVRVSHLSPNAPNVDVYVDGSAVLEDVPFGQTSDYLDLGAGSHTVEITAAGDADTVVFSGDVSVEADTTYTIAATGEIGDEADQAFEPLILEDDTSDPGSDMARVRLLHASPDAPAVDVTLASNGDAIYDGVAYGESGSVTVPAGDYTLQIRGDTESNDGDVVAESDVSLGGGEVYSAFAAGYLSPDDEPADTAFDLLFVPDAGATAADGTATPDGTASVRVSHLSPNAPNVDVYVDGSAVLEDVPYGQTSDYLELEAGGHDVEITAAGDADTVVFSGEVPVEADTAYTIAATGEIGDAADQAFEPLVLTDDNSDPGADMARVRLLHASPDAPAVDVTLASNGDAIYDGVAYGESEYVTVPAGDYTLQIRGDTMNNDGDVVAEYDVSLAGGQVYSAFAAGYLSPDDDPADTQFDLLLVQDTGGMGMGGGMGMEVPSAIDDFLADANGYDGSIADMTGQDEVTVTVGGGDLSFDPVAVRVDVGTTINWEWAGGTHNVASTEGSSSDFDSGDPTSDEETVFSQSFDNAGVQLYVCEVHEGGGMLGAIDVV
jgi:halocyanin-like protein